MSKATARIEFAALAEKAGFAVVHTHNQLVAYHHRRRNEGFQLTCEGDSFADASWFAPTEYVIVVDKRKPGERADRSGLGLGSNAKRRAVGMDEVRPQMRTSSKGMEVGYLELKRRVKDKDWRKAS